MSRPKHTYHLEFEQDGRWFRVASEPLPWLRGYMDCLRGRAGLRPAARIVRDDGQVMEAIAGETEASIGQVAGLPTPDQYLDAGARVIARATHLMSRRMHRGDPERVAAALDACERALAAARAELAP